MNVPFGVVFLAVDLERQVECILIVPHPVDGKLQQKQRVLLDTGAWVSYVDPRVVKKYKFETRPCLHSYTPIGADGHGLEYVSQQAKITFSFGIHVETHWFDIMPLGKLGMVLG